MVFLNEELGRPIPLKRLARWWGFDGKALATILQGNSYKDYGLEYTKLTSVQKEKLVSLLSN